MKDTRIRHEICTKRGLTTRLFAALLIGLLLCTASSCINVFRDKGKSSDNADADLQIGKAVRVYDDYLADEPSIRVLLLKDVKEFSIAVSSPFELFSSGTPPHGDTRKPLKSYGKLSRTVVTLTNTHIHIGTNRHKRETIEIVTADGGTININGAEYGGKVIIVPQTAGTFLVIEEAGVEDYLMGVLGSEMPSSWQPNTLFAQAVAARTYILYKKKKRRSLTHHIGKLDLAYKGKQNTNKTTEKIVNKSRGIIMVYNWEIFPGYFHSTCGGHTEDVYHVFKKKSIPPLSGTSCGYCNSSKYYRWQTDINKDELAKKLSTSGNKIYSIQSISTLNPGPGGHAEVIEVHSRTKRERVDANKFRLLAGPNKLYSTAFTVNVNQNSITMKGKGWGHGVGLCQYGAQGMGISGFKWHEILKHYYPEIDLLKIY